MNDNDQYVQWDAAYVLGALVGADRAQYEEHLAGCDPCRAAVAELAGLPGLLGQLSPAEAIAVESDAGSVDGVDGPFADPLAVPEHPASLMPPLLEIGPVPRRWLAPMAAAAAALLIGGVGGYAVSQSQDAVPGNGPSSTLALGTSRLAFAAVSASPMTAVVDVVPTGQGTELRVECQYAPATSTTSPAGAGATGAATGTVSGSGPTPSKGTGSRAGDGGYPGIRYAIWVVGRDGRDMQVKDWTARSGRVMHPSGVTSWSVDQIESVEIRLADTGDTVMRAQVG
ncbi:MAG: zf-HC2 domain-containing protein [Pedococcus sp.]